VEAETKEQETKEQETKASGVQGPGGERTGGAGPVRISGPGRSFSDILLQLRRV
jgi:hypothetical protein